jgi:hypothetical protein
MKANHVVGLGIIASEQPSCGKVTRGLLEQ